MARPKSDVQKWKDRKYRLLLYPEEDKTHAQAIEYIKANYDYAMITHDKDTEEETEGKLKKSHVHVVVRLKGCPWSTSFAKTLGIEHNYIMDCKSLDKSLEYLIHWNNPEKYQYNIDEVKGNLKNRLKEIVNSEDKTEGEIVREMLEYIKSQTKPITITEFATWVVETGHWAVYRRASTIFKDCIAEHNKYLADKKRKERRGLDTSVYTSAGRFPSWQALLNYMNESDIQTVRVEKYIVAGIEMAVMQSMSTEEVATCAIESE